MEGRGENVTVHYVARVDSERIENQTKFNTRSVFRNEGSTWYLCPDLHLAGPNRLSTTTGELANAPISPVSPHLKKDHEACNESHWFIDRFPTIYCFHSLIIVYFLFHSFISFVSFITSLAPNAIDIIFLRCDIVYV